MQSTTDLGLTHPSDDESESPKTRKPVSAKLAVALPIAAGLLLTIMFFQTIVGAFAGFAPLMLLVAFVVWSLGLAAAVQCFFRVSKRWACIGLALSFIGTPLVPYLIVLVFSPEQRSVYADAFDGIMQLVESDRHALSTSDQKLGVMVPPDNYIGDGSATDFGTLYPAYVPKTAKSYTWSADESVLVLSTHAVAGSKAWCIDFANQKVLSIIGTDQARLPLVTAGELAIVRGDNLYLFSPETYQETATLRLSKPAATAAHPTTDLIVVGNGGIDKARLIHVPTRTQLKVLRRSDVPESSAKVGNGTTLCSPNFNTFEFTPDGNYFVTTNSGSIGGKSISFRDAFYEVKEDDLSFVGYRFELPAKLQKRYPPKSSSRGYLDSYPVPAPDAAKGFVSSDRGLTYWNGENYVPAQLADETGKSQQLHARIISPSMTKAVAFVGDKIFLALYDPPTSQ